MIVHFTTIGKVASSQSKKNLLTKNVTTTSSPRKSSPHSPFEAFCQATEGRQNIYRDERDLDDLDPGCKIAISGKSPGSRPPPQLTGAEKKGPISKKGKVDQKNTCFDWKDILNGMIFATHVFHVERLQILLLLHSCHHLPKGLQNPHSTQPLEWFAPCNPRRWRYHLYAAKLRPVFTELCHGWGKRDGSLGYFFLQTNFQVYILYLFLLGKMTGQ